MNIAGQDKTEKERLDEKHIDMGRSAKWEVYLGIYGKTGVRPQRYSPQRRWWNLGEQL